MIGKRNEIKISIEMRLTACSGFNTKHIANQTVSPDSTPSTLQIIVDILGRKRDRSQRSTKGIPSGHK